MNPPYPSQETLDFMKKSKQWEMQMKLIADNTFGVLSPLHEIQRNVENMASNTSSISSVDSRNFQPSVSIGDIHVTCRGSRASRWQNSLAAYWERNWTGSSAGSITGLTRWAGLGKHEWGMNFEGRAAAPWDMGAVLKKYLQKYIASIK